jgi:CheY-specific phosphatase CheX
MPAPISVEISPAELTQVVESVFGTMLGLDVRSGETAWSPGTDRLIAAVHLTGEWHGAVLVECGPAQACAFAERFLSIERPAAVDDVVRDVLGEVANMIGGNLKCVLTRGLRLSMPSVVSGSHCHLRVCRSGLHLRQAFVCAEGPFWVTVLAMDY